MSLAGFRDALAAALDPLPTINGHKTRPTSPRKGDAWPVLAVLEHGPAYTWETTWRLMVVLGPESAAVDFLDEHFDAIADALRPVAYVVSAEPVNLGPSDDQVLPGLAITMRSE